MALCQPGRRLLAHADRPAIWNAVAGPTIGAGSGALGGALSDVGVDDKVIKQVGSTIEPGHSVLFLLVESGSEEKVKVRTR